MFNVIRKVLFAGLCLTLVACRVELAENEEAQLNLAWTCVYRAGQTLQCPAKAIAKVKDKTSSIAVKALRVSDNQIASAGVNLAVSLAISSLIPGDATKQIECLETAGDGVCKLVRLANKDKFYITGMPNQKTLKNTKKGTPFRILISAVTNLLNEGSFSSGGSYSSEGYSYQE